MKDFQLVILEHPLFFMHHGLHAAIHHTDDMIIVSIEDIPKEPSILSLIPIFEIYPLDDSDIHLLPLLCELDPKPLRRPAEDWVHQCTKKEPRLSTRPPPSGRSFF